MATLRKRNGKWQVQIRRHGFKPISRTFTSKSDAHTWCRYKESQLDRSDLPSDPKALERITWKELLVRYRDTVVINKKCRVSETAHINAYLSRDARTTALSIANIKPHHFISYRNCRLASVKPATVCRELGIFHHVFETARTEWGLALSQNPLSLVKKPQIHNRRDRRIKQEEYLSILRALKECSNPETKPIVQIAIRTGMRKGEILNLKWKHINLDSRVLHIPETKNGHSRDIPLCSRSVRILKALKHNSSDKVFVSSANAVTLSWKRLLKRAKVVNLKFHDLRHEAISRFFELGLSVPEVALISGHKDYRMLFRYTHMKAESVVEKLR